MSLYLIRVGRYNLNWHMAPFNREKCNELLINADYRSSFVFGILYLIAADNELLDEPLDEFGFVC